MKSKFIAVLILAGVVIPAGAFAQPSDQGFYDVEAYGNMPLNTNPNNPKPIANSPTGESAPVPEKVEKKKERKLPKSGVLGVYGTAGPGSAKVDVPWGGVDTTGDKQAPLSGSVNKISADEWTVSVQNNSEDRYSANVTAKLMTDSGQVVKTQSYSLSLKPGETTQRSIRGAAAAKVGSLLLRNWKKTESESKDSNESEEEPEDDGTLR